MWAIEYLPHYSCGATALMKIESEKEVKETLNRINKAPKHPSKKFDPIVYRMNKA